MFRIQIIAPHPVVAAYLARISSGHPKLRRLLLPPIANLELLPGPGEPFLFVVDAFGLSLEVPALVRALRVRRRGSKFLLLLPPDQGGAEQVLRLLYTGIDGVAALSNNLEEELPAALCAILEGEPWAPPGVLADYHQQISLALNQELLASASVTGRESQIVQLMIRRLANKEIAEALGITERTVRFHVSNIFAKLQIVDRQSVLPALERLQYQQT
ncbi:MAG: helix-turn-helix transcriptional regulator [Terriglobales bacterium]